MAARVRRADASDVDVSCAVLADAFSDYEWTRWTVDADDHVRRIESLQRLFIERVALPHGEVWVAEDDDGLVASVALWMLPDSSVPASTWHGVATAQSVLEGARHLASVLAESAVVPMRPSAPHYYLGAVGTRSDCRQRGFATAVLAPMLDRAAAADSFAFLETSSAANVRFYTGLGFAVAGEVGIPGGGPHVWAMRRG